jgi:hypothetical protein
MLRRYASLPRPVPSETRLRAPALTVAARGPLRRYHDLADVRARFEPGVRIGGSFERIYRID